MRRAGIESSRWQSRELLELGRRYQALGILADPRDIFYLEVEEVLGFVDGATVTTIEGLSDGGVLHPVQQAFIDHDAFQCGYCTSGQICSAVGLMKEGRATDPDEIRELMSGNICRCGAYSNIVAAIQQAMRVGKDVEP